MGVILFDKLRLMANIGTRMKKTEGGARSTRISELEKLKDSHPIISEIVNYRELQKLLSTYIDAIPPLLDDNSRLHTHFIQTGTTTGRFLQPIPIFRIYRLEANLAGPLGTVLWQVKDTSSCLLIIPR